eukprot:768522-Hanusia_phi.AAC.5
MRYNISSPSHHNCRSDLFSSALHLSKLRFRFPYASPEITLTKCPGPRALRAGAGRPSVAPLA